MIKKLIIALLPTLASTAMANNQDIYFKGGFGINSIYPVRFEDNYYNGKNKLSNNFPMLEIGLGYKFRDGVRAEVVFDYHFMFHMREFSTGLLDEARDRTSKTQVNALMLNLYKDIATFDRITPFVGGGVGISFAKTASRDMYTNLMTDETSTQDLYYKRNSKFAYKLTGGVDIRINDNVTGELSYNCFSLNNSLGNTRKKYQNLTVHNITIGTRISL